MNDDLLELVYQHDELVDLDPAARRLAIRNMVVATGESDIAGAVARVMDEIDGLGPLADLMRDEDVTDILVNGPGEVWVERDGCLHRAAVRFTSGEALAAWCERTISRAGGRIDTGSPIADVRLADGARLHVVLPPVAPAGPLVSIRRQPTRARSLEDLIALGLVTDNQAALLDASVAEKRCIVISGATGSGKTTLMNALLLRVPLVERVVVIEELPELRGAPNAVSLVARPSNAEGRGSVTLADLVRASLRMRPDRIVIGEVRGPEALPAMWAMSTGHRGSMLSIHARSAAEASVRLVDLALSAPGAPAEGALHRWTKEVLDVVVHLERSTTGRVVAEILDTR